MTEVSNQTSEISGSIALSSLCLAVCFFTALLSAFWSPAAAQQATKVPRIGYISDSGEPSSPGPPIEAFRQGLRDIGYVEGQNILVEYRYGQGQSSRYPNLVAELLQLKVDVQTNCAYSFCLWM